MSGSLVSSEPLSMSMASSFDGDGSLGTWRGSGLLCFDTPPAEVACVRAVVGDGAPRLPRAAAFFCDKRGKGPQLELSLVSVGV